MGSLPTPEFHGCHSRKLEVGDSVVRLGNPPRSGILDRVATQTILNHATRRPCVDRVPGHVVLLAAVAAAPDRRIATPVDGLSAVRLRPRLRPADRIFWSWLSRRWSRWREVLVFVKHATVIAWQHKRFRDHWTRISHWTWIVPIRDQCSRTIAARSSSSRMLAAYINITSDGQRNRSGSGFV